MAALCVCSLLGANAQRSIHKINKLNEVKVESRTGTQHLRKEGYAVQVVEMRNVQNRSVQTLELLERTAGVKIRQDGGMGSHARLSINGLSGNAIKVLIDGVPAANYGSSFSLSSLPPSLIERIEIYKGVLPGQLSDDALGGAINIVLRQPRRNSLSVSYGLGSFGTHSANLLGGFRFRNGFTGELSLFHNQSRNDYYVSGDEIKLVDYMGRVRIADKPMKRFHDGYSSTGGKVGIGVTRRRWADRLMLSALFSRDYKEVQHGITMEAVYGDRHTRRQATVFALNYHKNGFVLPHLDVKYDLSLSLLHRQVIDTVGIQYDWAGPILDAEGKPLRYNGGAEIGSQPTLGINDEKTVMSRAQLSHPLWSGAKLFATHLYNDFRRKVSDPLQSDLQALYVNNRDLQKSVASLTYQQVAFNERLRANLFYKYYHQRVISHEVQVEEGKSTIIDVAQTISAHGAGFTLAYQLLPDLQLQASGERALRLPNANELFGNVADNLLPPSPALEPERSLNFNLAALYSTQIDDHSWGINATLYYRDVRGMIREAISTGTHVYSRYENLESVVSRGFDLEASYDYAHRLQIKGHVSRFATLFNTQYDKLGHPYQYYGMQIRNEPSLKAGAQVSYLIPGLIQRNSRLTLHSGCNYVNAFNRNWSNIGSNNLPIVPSQFAVDAGATYLFPGNRITLSIDAKNIFDQRAYDNFGLQKPGRSLHAKLTYIII